MRPRSRLLVCACLLAFAVDRSVLGAEPPTKQQVRALLYGAEFKGERRQLIEMGDKAFPAYQAILSDPKAKPAEVARLLGVLAAVKADRSRFRDDAVSRLRDADRMVRLGAVALLEGIGTPADAPPVVALLSDDYKPAAYAAAKTLTAIGGPREVLAMDIWLRGVSHRDDADLRKHVQKCRDALQKRLDQARRKEPNK